LTKIGEGGSSELVRLGSYASKRPPTDDVERFLTLLRFYSREKLQELKENGWNILSIYEKKVRFTGTAKG
jgi:hypothetical protein